jgi:hypothetical protein
MAPVPTMRREGLAADGADSTDFTPQISQITQIESRSLAA